MRRNDIQNSLCKALCLYSWAIPANPHSPNINSAHKLGYFRSQCEALPPPLTTRYRLILCWVPLTHACRDSLTHCIRIESKEERHRIPRFLRAIVHSVHSRAEPIVGKPLQEVTDVDNQRAGYGGSVEPFRSGGEDLQAAERVLPEERE